MFNKPNRRLLCSMVLGGLLAMGCGGAGGGGSSSGDNSQSSQGGSVASAAQQAEHYMGQAGFAISEDDIEGALGYYLEAARIYDSTGEVTINRAEAHTEAAKLTYRLGDLEEAIAQYQIAVDIFMRFSGNSKIKAAVGLNNMGTIYKELEKKDKARNCWENALQIYKAAPPELQNRSNMATIEQNLSDLQEGF